MQRINFNIILIVLILIITNSNNLKAQDIVDVLNSKNNYFYAGVDNELKITVAEPENYDTLLISISNGLIFKDSINYNCIPRRSGRANLTIKGVKHNSDTTNIFSKSFLVYTIPPVKLTIGGKTVDELTKMSKDFILQNDIFGIHLSDDIINCDSWVNIERVTMGYLSGGGYYKRDEFKGNKLPENFKQIIASFPSGKELSFEVRLSYTGNIQKNLPVFITRVY